MLLLCAGLKVEVVGQVGLVRVYFLCQSSRLKALGFLSGLAPTRGSRDKSTRRGAQWYWVRVVSMWSSPAPLPESDGSFQFQKEESRF